MDSAKTRQGPNGCVVWTRSCNADGYGKVWHEGKSWLVHRRAWSMHMGPIPHGMKVLHTCDNPPCCNVDHLFLGTNQDNADDMMRKNRARPVRGEAHSRAKVTESQVLEIRVAYAAGGTTHRKLAARYGICASQVTRIINREFWGHVK